MCLEPSLCPDRHREFARANKFQSQRISAESSLQPVLLRPAPHFPASSCCSNRGKEASHYNDTFDSFAKSTWGGAKERSSVLSWKNQTLWGGILEILLLVNLNGWAPTQRSTWAAIPRECREQASPGFSLSRTCPAPCSVAFKVSAWKSGYLSLCLGSLERHPWLLNFSLIPCICFCPSQPCFKALLFQHWAFTRPLHQLNASPKPGSSCSCGEKFYSHQDLIVHMEKHHGKNGDVLMRTQNLGGIIREIYTVLRDTKPFGAKANITLKHQPWVRGQGFKIIILLCL